MGMLQFRLADFECLPEGALDLAYLSNHDEIPVATSVVLRNNVITASRVDSESCTFTIPWRTVAYGEVAVTTGTLIQRAAPYLLPVELARGTLYRTRTLAFLWSLVGLALPEEFQHVLDAATRRFAVAASGQENTVQANAAAAEALEGALHATRILMRAYGSQALVARRQVEARPPILVGARLDHRAPTWPFTEFLLQACNTVQAPLGWMAIERSEGEYDWEASDAQVAWAQAHTLRICGGPLVCFDQGGVPQSLAGSGDLSAIQERVANHVRRVVERYRGRIQLWHAVASPNVSGAFAISEEQRVRLAVHVIETVRNTDPRTPVVVSFKQPWGEFLRQDPSELSPLHFADVLCRAELGLSGLALEIDVGLRQGMTIPREPLDWSRQLDRWTNLNLPLMLLISRANGFGGCGIEQWLAEFGPVWLGKPAVQAVMWSQLVDGAGPDAMQNGLYDAEGQPKAVLRAFGGLKQHV